MANQLATAYATDTKCGTATDFSKCPKVTLTIPQDNADVANEAAAARQMWLKAMPKYPITIQVNYTPDLLQTTSADYRIQFQAISWLEDYPDPQDWLTTNLACDSVYNVGNGCDPTADALMKAADANPSQPARLLQYQQAEQLLVTVVGWLPLDQATTWWETQPYLVNFTITAGGLIPKESWQTLYILSH